MIIKKVVPNLLVNPKSIIGRELNVVVLKKIILAVKLEVTDRIHVVKAITIQNA